MFAFKNIFILFLHPDRSPLLITEPRKFRVSHKRFHGYSEFQDHYIKPIMPSRFHVSSSETFQIYDARARSFPLMMGDEMQKSVWSVRVLELATGDVIKQTNYWSRFSRPLYRHLTYSHTPLRAACLVSTLRTLRQWNSFSLRTKHRKLQ